MAAVNEKAAARKARTRSASKQNLAPVPDQPLEAEQDVQAPDGILLIKETLSDGSINVRPQIIGNVQITEVQTIIEFGLRAARQMIGLDERK